MTELDRLGYDAWKLSNGDDESDERERRQQEREDAEVRSELRAERERFDNEDAEGPA